MIDFNARWRPVSKAEPCPACGHSDWCAWTPDGQRLRCMRQGDPPEGMRRLNEDADGGVLFTFDKLHVASHRRSNRSTPAPGRAQTTDWGALSSQLQATITPDQIRALAESLGLPVAAVRVLDPGWATRDDLKRMRAGGAGWTDDPPQGAFAFPERDGTGKIVGLSLRTLDGRKGSPSGKAGSRRGLIVPSNFHEIDGPILCVEGATDVAAAVLLGIRVVGRPSCNGGAEDLAKIADAEGLIVLGERDTKPNGRWPGRDGAKAVAAKVAQSWREPVEWSLPPKGVKDLRDLVRQRVEEGLDPSDPNACHDEGTRVLESLRSTAREAKPKKASQSDRLFTIAMEQFDLGQDQTGRAFAVPRNGPRIACLFRGAGDSLRSALAREYQHRFQKVPSSSALADAIAALEGVALSQEREHVALRVATVCESDASDNSVPNLLSPGVAIDLGTETGEAVIVRAGEWELLESSPVLFRRSPLTAALPIPKRGGDLRELRGLLSVDDRTWPLILGWLVATLLPDIPVPVLMLGGLQGTGKTTAARVLTSITDPATAACSEPQCAEQWAVAASNGRVITIDNVSRIRPWWSDALCKAVTGDGWVTRKLYTNGDISVLQIRCAVVITSIDAGALRGDLGDRLLLVELPAIPDDRRRTEADLDRELKALRPRAFGALLDLLGDALRVLPDVRLEELPRMADFAKVLAALDQVAPELTGGKALDLYLAQRGSIAETVVDADVIGEAIVGLIKSERRWEGTSGDMLKRIAPQERIPCDWPRNGQAMTARLKRLMPALESVGIRVTIPQGRTNRGRIITIERTADSGEAARSSSQLSRLPPKGLHEAAGNTGRDDLALQERADRHQDRHSERGDEGASGGLGDNSDDRDGLSPPSSVGIGPGQLCLACGREDWWRSCGSQGWTCGRCHPPVDRLAVEWDASRQPS